MGMGAECQFARFNALDPEVVLDFFAVLFRDVPFEVAFEQIENFLGAVERGSWRRGYPRTEPLTIERLHRRTSKAGASSHLNQEPAAAELFRLERK